MPSTGKHSGMNCAVDLKVITKAVTSLKRYLQAQDNDELLGDDDEFLYLMLSLKKSHPLHRKDKPIRIPLPHPIYHFKDSEICLFVKDDKSGAGHKAAKKRLANFADKAGISKVIGTSKLRAKYESYESKRNLCRQFDLFLADDRVLPSLPKLIGKSFFRRKKQPIPIDMRATDLPAQFDKAQQCTTLILSGGSCLSIKFARASFAVDAAVSNVEATLAGAVQHVPKGWDNIQAVFIKSTDSVALPVFQCLPEKSSRIA
jgi:ribosome biogenesis protein UTP30